MMNQDVTHTNDLGPRDLWTAISDVGIERPCSLTDNLKMMQNPDLHQFFPLEDGSASLSVLLDSFDGLQDVQEAFPVVPHSGTASPRT